jgi:hypothetical protein
MGGIRPYRWLAGKSGLGLSCTTVLHGELPIGANVIDILETMQDWRVRLSTVSEGAGHRLDP